LETESVLKTMQDAEDIDWYQKFEVIKNSGIFSPGWALVKPESFFSEIELTPEFFKNKRVLDIGADAGAYSFFLEDCSANVTAMDPRNPDKNGFNIIKSIRGSKINYIRKSIYDIAPKEFGFFDVILLVNVSQHLKHPLLAMEKINAISKKNTLLIGTWHCCDSWFPVFDIDEVHECGVSFDQITGKKIRNKRILSAPKLNDISICGFGYASYANYIFFYPNICCFGKWLEVSGFKADYIKRKKNPLWSREKREKKNHRRIPRSLNDLKSWYTNRIRRKRTITHVYFRAQYSGPAELEYGERQLRL
jgi:SAM-dependent methyltransferase